MEERFLCPHLSVLLSHTPHIVRPNSFRWNLMREFLERNQPVSKCWAGCITMGPERPQSSGQEGLLCLWYRQEH